MQTISAAPIPTPPEKPKKEKGTGHFWRACGFLYPYRKMIGISVICAIFVGAANTAGLSTLLPIMRVLTKGDTIASWADREIAQRRLGVRFSDEMDEITVVSVTPGGPAASAGLRKGNILVAPPTNTRADMHAMLSRLSDPASSRETLQLTDGRTVSLSIAPLSRSLILGRAVAARFSPHPVWAIAQAFGFIFVLAVFSNCVRFVQSYLSDKAATLAVNGIRRQLYDRVLHVPLSHFNMRGASDVTSRLTQDAQGLAEGFRTVLGQSIQEPIKAAMAFGLAVFISWKLTLFIVVFSPVMLVIIRKFGKKMRRASRKAMVSSANMLGQIEGSLAGIRVVKGANAERFERRRYTRIMDKLVDEQLRMSRIDNISEPVVEMMTLVVVAAVVLVASYMCLISHSMEVTSFYLMMACLASIGDSLRRVSKVNNVLQKSNAAAGRIFEIMDLPIEKKGWHSSNRSWLERSKPAATSQRVARSDSAPLETVAADGDHRPRIKLPPLQREVRFENITFAYPGAPAPAIVNVSLAVPRGRCVAVVGRNGSGKTTLLALLPRFFDPQKGRVLVDGVDIRDCTLRSLRDQISLVTQDSVIFSGTVLENIAYGHPLATAPADSIAGKRLRAQVEDAARRAYAHEFIVEKPQGYETLLGGLGAQLSGGQKQRICIARAILRETPILVLDEATSQVDAESEAKIQAAINSLIRERTTFVIAHRFSTILNADEIVVMDRGQIVGQGRHDDLLQSCETYQHLYERQLVVPPAA